MLNMVDETSFNHRSERFGNSRIGGWLKDDGNAAINGPVTVQGRGSILTKAVRQRPNSVIPPSVSRERLTRMASGGAPATIALSSWPDGNLTIDFIDRGETGVEVPVPELSVD